MKRIALLLSLLFPSFVSADYMLPDGCYVAYSNPNYCFDIPAGQTLVWTQSTDQSLLAPSYGYAVAIMLSLAEQREIDLNQCIDDYNALVAQFNSRTDQYNLCASDYNKQLKLVKKLRKKCGKPCKKIK